jgi:hypothetical protein
MTPRRLSLSTTAKVVFVALVASTLFLGSGFTSNAWAQKKRVVVELFKGPNAERVRLAVVRSLLKQRIEVVQVKKVAMVEADLGLIRASDNYPAVARELKVNAFVGGTVMPGKRPRARIVVRSPDGGVVGQTAFQGMNVIRLIANIDNGGGPRLVAMVGSAKGGGGGGGEVDGLLAEGGGGGGGGGGKKALAAAEPPPEKPARAEPAEEEAPPRASKAAKPDADVETEAEAPPAKSSSKATKTASAGGTGLNLAFVMRMFSRNFSYNQNAKGGQQGYQAPEQKFNNLPLVPAPGLAIEYFPMRYIGGQLSYNRAIAGSKDTGGSVYKTTAYDWAINAKGRIDVIGMQVEPVLGYVAKVFEIQNFATSENRIQVAPVSYRHVRVGAGVRMPFDSGAAISAGGAYLHTLGAGDILDPAKYFSGNSLAGELYAAMTFPLGFAKGFDLRLGADFRRIAFAFTPNLGANRIAGGAVDQYIGVNVGIGYNLDL